jgi:hypothetical protein
MRSRLRSRDDDHGRTAMTGILPKYSAKVPAIGGTPTSQFAGS